MQEKIEFLPTKNDLLQKQKEVIELKNESINKKHNTLQQQHEDLKQKHNNDDKKVGGIIIKLKEKEESRYGFIKLISEEYQTKLQYQNI
eukprot:Pgem_evm1s9091